MTLMVRDEIDIIAAMLEHHIAQGVDLIIATDNGSVDGTTEVLKDYAAAGYVELHHDPEHRKQQGERVTAMARRAFTEHGADWVINADADEFFVPVDRSLTLRDCLERIGTELGAFTVPVTNLVGPPAERGSGIDRLVYRDLRTDEQLQAIGIHAQPTPNAIHRGDAEVTVSQGNHVVSIPSTAQPDAAVAIEVLHLPWRSWEQLQQKVTHAGRAYEASPTLRPSKNHHGMWDYRRQQAGRLRHAFGLRQPTSAELESDDGFEYDPRLRDRLHALVASAVVPERLAASLDATNDELIDAAEHAELSTYGRMFHALERAYVEEQQRADRLAKQLARAKSQPSLRAAARYLLLRIKRKLTRR